MALTDKLTEIGNAIRAREQSTELILLSEMPSRIAGISGKLPCFYQIGNHYDDNSVWHRPKEWPDLDSLTYNSNEIYMTIDNSGRIDDPHISLLLSTSGIVTWEIGIISNGTFIARETNEGASIDRLFTKDDPVYPVLHIISTENIMNWNFIDSVQNGHLYNKYMQALIERVGNLYDYGTGNWGGYYLEREKVNRIFCSEDGLQNTWQNCISLQSLDVSGWNTVNWTVTNLKLTWQNCISLQSLDLSNWDTTRWTVMTLHSPWSNCYSLRLLNINSWNTTNWKVTELTNTWYHCYSLLSLDLSNWDTTNWKITSLYYTWDSCYSLQLLNINNWNTTNWIVTSLSKTWYKCYSLVSLNLSDWNTVNWKVTDMMYTWSNCNLLQFLDIGNWNTTNWEVISLRETWAGLSIKSLDLSKWNTTNWKVANLEKTWHDCQSLISLDLSNWDTTNWVVTTLANSWNGCYSLVSLNLSGWNTTNWKVNDLSGTFGYCHSLKSINLSKWDTTNWSYSNCYCLFYGTCACRSVNISSLDVSKIVCLGNNSYYNLFGEMLEEFICGENNYNKFIPIENNYLYFEKCNFLKKSSVLEIIKMLGNVTTKHVLAFANNVKNKLNTEEIAMITEKGWTLA